MNIQIVSIPRITDQRGDISFIESNGQIPFDIKRVYYIYNVKDGSERGEHAHKSTTQVLFCLSGSVKICFDDGVHKKEVILDEPHIGVLIPEMIRHSMKEYTKNCIMLVVASEVYDESDYIRDYDSFLNLSLK